MVRQPSVTRRSFLGTLGPIVVSPFVWTLAPPIQRARADDEGIGEDSVRIPDWVWDVRLMAFGSIGDLDLMAEAGIQVLHTNVLWPYSPLITDGGGPGKADAKALEELVEACHRRKIRLSLGLPPFPDAALINRHPEWRVRAEDSDAPAKVVGKDDDLGTRIACNLSPWGDYLIEVCGELVKHFGVDGFSFDGNYHPAICFCPACKRAHREQTGEPIPPAVDLNRVEYRGYLAWRGERLIEHYRRMQRTIKGINPDAVLMSWTVNAGRYGHLLHSPRAMPSRLNRWFDLPMQEWWLDETNLGASVAPAFGAAYLHATTGGRPCASEPYLMSRGNPYGTHSFPKHEREVRSLLALSQGNVVAQSFGWPGHRESTVGLCKELARRGPWLKGAVPLRWGAILVGEQTRQFYAYRNIPELFLPHVFGAFRMAQEEHLPIRLINDWDLTPEGLAGYRVLLLPNAAALSAAQAEAVRRFVTDGGGLVATGETSLCDELGRPGKDFALADLFGVSFRGRPQQAARKVELDANFSVHLDDDYWNQRVGLGTLRWQDHPIVRDEQLRDLVPDGSTIFRGPQVLVSEPADPAVVFIRLRPDGQTDELPGGVARAFGRGRVVYLPAAIDAALWSYGYPYQRVLLARAVEWAAGGLPEIRVRAPMCVQATFFRQRTDGKDRQVLHFFNDLNTAGHHGLPSAEVPLREEAVPIHGIRVEFRGEVPRSCRWEPEGVEVPLKAGRTEADVTVAELPELGVHGMLVAEF